MTEIILIYDPDLSTSQGSLFQINFSLRNVGVRGAHIFHFSYKFLGTVGSKWIQFNFMQTSNFKCFNNT